MSATEGFSILLLIVSGVFFLAGTAGLLRFPDTLSRLHALTKADNLGLGILVAALAPHAGSTAAAIKLVVIWLLVMLFSSGANYLVARHAVTLDDAGDKRD